MMKSIWDEPCIFAPSLICLDHLNLERDVGLVERSGIGMLHVDILDGHFSPSLPMGLDTVRQLRSRTDLPFDAHLMTTTPDYFVDELLDIGVQQLTVHCEYTPHLDWLLGKIKSRGVRAGVALKPATPLSALDYAIEIADSVLLMLINPGYAGSPGEKQVRYADRKINELHELIGKTGRRVDIELDGRVSLENISRYSRGLVQTFAIGSTCLKGGPLEDRLRELHALEKRIRNGEVL